MHAYRYTKRYKDIQNQLSSPLVLINPMTGTRLETEGIWDTGATLSCITQKAAHHLGLQISSYTTMRGVNSSKVVPVYIVRLQIGPEVSVLVEAAECEQLVDDGTAELLIGMDVITKGDFAVSNFQNQTTLTFRFPSHQHMDFVAEARAPKPPAVADKIGRNKSCHCGSGKKFKHCHGRDKAA